MQQNVASEWRRAAITKNGRQHMFAEQRVDCWCSLFYFGQLFNLLANASNNCLLYS